MFKSGVVIDAAPGSVLRPPLGAGATFTAVTIRDATSGRLSGLDHRRIVRTAHRDRRAGGAFVGPARGPRGVWRRDYGRVVRWWRAAGAAQQLPPRQRRTWCDGSGARGTSARTERHCSKRRGRLCGSGRACRIGGPTDTHWQWPGGPRRTCRPGVADHRSRRSHASERHQPRPLSRPPVEERRRRVPATLGHSPLAVRHSSS